MHTFHISNIVSINAQKPKQWLMAMLIAERLLVILNGVIDCQLLKEGNVGIGIYYVFVIE